MRIITQKFILSALHTVSFGNSPEFIYNKKVDAPYAGEANFKSNDQFIQEARLIHNDKYNYSKVEYVNNNTKVCIICLIHGEFMQTPTLHINKKSGCP